MKIMNKDFMIQKNQVLQVVVCFRSFADLACLSLRTLAPNAMRWLLTITQALFAFITPSKMRASCTL
jgi:hypothetical protein